MLPVLAGILALIALLAPLALAQTTNIAPTITQQPASVTTNEYRSVVFTVTATGTAPLAYQWRLDGNPIRNATNSSLLVFGVDATNAGPYSVVVTNVAGSVTSSNAILTVIGPPRITQPPVGVTTNQGATVTFNVGAIGTPSPSYQWQFNNVNLPGATNATLTISDVQTNQAGGYSVIVSNSAGSIGVPAVTLTVNVPPAITQQPASVTTNQGVTVAFIVTATGTPPLQYQWLVGGSPIAGATNAVFSLSSAQLTNAGIYLVVVTGPGGSVTSSNAVLTIFAVPLPTITEQPTNQVLLVGDPLNLSVAATGTPPLQYQWLLGGNPLGGATNSTFSLNSAQLTDAGTYQVVVSGPGGSVTSSNAVVTVLVPPTISVQPASQSVHVGGLVGLSVMAAGTPPLQYQWLLGGNAIAGATNSTVTFFSAQLTNAGIYQVLVSGPGGSVASSNAVLTVLASPAITVQPESISVFPGSPAAFSVSALGAPPLQYQWLFGGDPIAGATNSVFSLNSVQLTNLGIYQMVVSGPGGSLTSSNATLAFLEPPTITQQPLSQTNFAGANVSLRIGVSGTGPFSYQWQFNGTNLPNNFIITVAGGGNQSPGDGGLATQASLNVPQCVTVDESGNLFIADSGSSLIRRVDVNGVINTMAGNRMVGYSGDGGWATNASLNNPFYVASDHFGNLFIADFANSRIRKVDLNGVITTVTGNGSVGYSGDSGAATNASLDKPACVVVDASGTLYIADGGNCRIRTVDANGIINTIAGNGTVGTSGDNGGSATNASLGYPAGVTVDFSHNLFIADTAYSLILKVDVNNRTSIVAGNGFSGYSGDGGPANNSKLFFPTSIAMDASGNLFIADYYNNRIRKIDVNGIITTVAGIGSAGYSGDGVVATNASLNHPNCVALDASGNLFIADTQNARVREVPLGGIPTLALDSISSINAGNYQVIVTSPYGSVTSAVATLTVQTPPYILVQPADLVLADRSTASFTAAAIGDQPLFYSWYFNDTNLVQIATNSSLTLTNVSLAASGNYSVVITNLFGNVTSRGAILSVGIPPTITSEPIIQIVSGPSTTILSVQVSGTGPFNYQWQLNGTNLLDDLITTVAGGGTNSPGDGGPATKASLNSPSGVAVDASGNLFIADGVVRKVNGNGVITTVAGGGTNYPGDGGPATNATLLATGLAVDRSGNLFIGDNGNYRIRKVDPNGVLSTIAGSGLNYPSAAVAVDGSDNVFIADQINNVVRKLDFNGVITTVAGSGADPFSNFLIGDWGPATEAILYSPYGVVVDASGNLFIADTYENRIREVYTNGVIATIAGNSPIGPTSGGYAGDGGAARGALFAFPHGMAVDASGNLFIADSWNNRVRRVDTQGIITTVAGSGPTGADPGSYSGDGGAGTNATLSRPTGVAVDAAGNLFIADQGNGRVRKVALGGAPTLNLSNSHLANLGNYQVIVTSPYGSVNSADVIRMRVPLLVGTNLLLGFNLAKASNTSFTLLQSPNLTGPWTTNTTAILTTNAQSGSYQYSLPAPGSVEFYQLRLP